MRVTYIKVTYMNRANRDAAWRKMSKSEQLKHRKSSMRGQLMHPKYIADYEQETGVKLQPEDLGFGNSVYRTYFKAIYSIEELRPSYY